MNLNKGFTFEMEVKKCSTCGTEKSTNDYYKQTGGKFGVQGTCMSCIKNRQEEFRKKSKEYLRNKDKSYYIKNKQTIVSRTADWRRKNREHASEHDKRYRDKNKEHIKELQKRHSESRIKHLSYGYVKSILQKLKIPVAHETIHLKRLQIKIKRRIKNEAN